MGSPLLCDINANKDDIYLVISIRISSHWRRYVNLRGPSTYKSNIDFKNLHEFLSYYKHFKMWSRNQKGHHCYIKGGVQKR